MTIRFVADEGCDFTVVRALRKAGFDDVLAISRSGSTLAPTLSPAFAEAASRRQASRDRGKERKGGEAMIPGISP